MMKTTTFKRFVFIALILSIMLENFPSTLGQQQNFQQDIAIDDIYSAPSRDKRMSNLFGVLRENVAAEDLGFLHKSNPRRTLEFKNKDAPPPHHKRSSFESLPSELKVDLPPKKSSKRTINDIKSEKDTVQEKRSIINLYTNHEPPKTLSKENKTLPEEDSEIENSTELVEKEPEKGEQLEEKETEPEVKVKEPEPVSQEPEEDEAVETERSKEKVAKEVTIKDKEENDDDESESEGNWMSNSRVINPSSSDDEGNGQEEGLLSNVTGDADLDGDELQSNAAGDVELNEEVSFNNASTPFSNEVGMDQITADRLAGDKGDMFLNAEEANNETLASDTSNSETSEDGETLEGEKSKGEKSNDETSKDGEKLDGEKSDGEKLDGEKSNGESSDPDSDGVANQSDATSKDRANNRQHKNGHRHKGHGRKNRHRRKKKRKSKKERDGDPNKAKYGEMCSSSKPCIGNLMECVADHLALRKMSKSQSSNQGEGDEKSNEKTIAMQEDDDYENQVSTKTRSHGQGGTDSKAPKKHYTCSCKPGHAPFRNIESKIVCGVAAGFLCSDSSDKPLMRCASNNCVNSKCVLPSGHLFFVTPSEHGEGDFSLFSR